MTSAEIRCRSADGGGGGGGGGASPASNRARRRADAPIRDSAGDGGDRTGRRRTKTGSEDGDGDGCDADSRTGAAGSPPRTETEGTIHRRPYPPDPGARRTGRSCCSRGVDGTSTTGAPEEQGPRSSIRSGGGVSRVDPGADGVGSTHCRCLRRPGRSIRGPGRGSGDGGPEVIHWPLPLVMHRRGSCV